MSLISFLPFVLKGDVAYQAYLVVDTITGILLRLSGLGILAWGSSLQITTANKDLLELYNLHLIKKFRYIACMLIDANQACVHQQNGEYLKRTELLKRLLNTSKHCSSFNNIYKDENTNSNTNLITLNEIKEQKKEDHNNNNEKQQYVNNISQTNHNDNREKESKNKSCQCICKSETFQESLVQLAAVAEEAYAHILVIEKRRLDHYSSWVQYLPGYGNIDHSANVAQLRDHIVPLMVDLTHQCRESCVWARNIFS